MPDDSDDDGYNGYGGYNECDECDRGYYYRNRRYEKRGFPMMSPIISPLSRFMCINASNYFRAWSPKGPIG
ncbi:unnamed protein product [Rhizophagus irregularis]|nr:unnamed protein product [Rhizophagus irregularis]